MSKEKTRIRFPLNKTNWPKSLKDIYSKGILKLPLQEDCDRLVNVRIIDVGIPEPGERYISSLGTVTRMGTTTNSRSMTRIIVEFATEVIQDETKS